MKSTLFEYTLPYKNGTHRKGLILQKEERFAEIAPLPGWSRETLEEAKKETIQWMKEGTPPTAPSVCWGIECLNHPLGPVRIPLSALGWREGFESVKLKLGALPVDRAIVLVKKHFKKARLRLDCNRAWTLSQALEFARHFEPDDFDYLEDPVQTMEELISFSQTTRFPIALDEEKIADLSQIPSLKAIVVKPTLSGFIPRIPPPFQLVLSSSYESGIGLLHIANRVESSLPAGLDTGKKLKQDLLLQPIETSSGFFSWPHSTLLIDSTPLSLICAL